MAIEKIFLLHHTHVDLGYTDLRSVVEQQLVDMVDTALDLAIRSASRPEPERFRWIHEVSSSRRAKVSLRRSAALARHLECESEDGYCSEREEVRQAVFMFDEQTWGDSRSVNALFPDAPWESVETMIDAWRECTGD